MSLPSFVQPLVGMWNGSSRLNLPWPPENPRLLSCDSTLEMTLGTSEAYAKIDYSWTYEGDAQSGFILLTCDTEKGTASMGWSDSWHQNSNVLHLTGAISDAKVTCLGHYTWEDSEPFGWEIELALKDGNLVLRMVNIEPSGQREWAVEAIYRRV
ncbi:MAG: DUF1579 family protein [Armatimonadetes bacterium]|nr:DUF1579 family protein [Armatimonadota bacterium]